MMEVLDALPEITVVHLGLSIIWAGIVYGGARILAPVIGAEEANAGYWQWALVFAVTPALCGIAGAVLYGFGFTPSPAVDFMFEPVDLPILTDLPKQSERSVGRAISFSGLVIKVLALSYALGVLVWVLRAGVGFVQLNRLVGAAIPIRDASLEACLRDAASRIAPDRRVRFLVSDDPVSPFLFDFFFVPARIVFPQAALERLSADQLALIVAHEAAHLKRGDALRWLVFDVLSGLFWFNPFVALLVSRSRFAIELTCDSRALEQDGSERRLYADALIKSLRISSGLSEVSAGPRFSSPPIRREKMRLYHILTKTVRPRLYHMRALAVGMTALTVTSIAGFAHIALAGVSEKEVAFEATVVSGRLTAGFGHHKKGGPFHGKRHNGTDIAAPTGTPIHTPADGIVTKASDTLNSKAWGKGVIIDHGNGWMTRYAQMDTYTVKPGQKVKAGAVIGTVGATGRATGPHLHIELMKDGEYVDPLSKLTFDLKAKAMK